MTSATSPCIERATWSCGQTYCVRRRALIASTCAPALLALLCGSLPVAARGEQPGTTANALPRTTNSIGMQLVQVPAGEFSLGLPDADRSEELPSEYAPHRVRITRPFYLGVHEVTQQQYSRVMEANPAWHAATGEGAGSITGQDSSVYPVEQVSWHDAEQFCRRLSQIADEQKAGRSYRLPTEAEWEYACRAGKTAPLAGAAKSSTEEALRPIGSGTPNEFGLHDMRASVWEWCADWYGVGYYSASPREDPQGPQQGVLRVVRGRDWIFSGFGNRPYLTRDPSPPSRKSKWIGFRVVCDMKAAASQK